MHSINSLIFDNDLVNISNA